MEDCYRITRTLHNPVSKCCTKVQCTNNKHKRDLLRLTLGLSPNLAGIFKGFKLCITWNKETGQDLDIKKTIQSMLNWISDIHNCFLITYVVSLRFI